MRWMVATLVVLSSATGCRDRSKRKPRPRTGLTATLERHLRQPIPKLGQVTEKLRASDPETRPYVLRWPLGSIDVTSPYGIRHHPVVHRTLFHAGVDFRAPRGEPVLAAGPGLVVQAGWLPLTGLTVTLHHPGRLATLYAHLDECLVFEGLRVRAGAPVGLLGSTGRSTGPHLHFSVYRLQGRERFPVNPSELIGTVIDPRSGPSAGPSGVPPPAPQQKGKAP